MQIKRHFLQKYIQNIAIDQIADDYKQKGYQISKEEQLGNYRADLIVRKDNEIIVIEVKAGKLTAEKKETIAGLGNYVKNQGNYKFLVVIASEPKEKKLEIPNIEELLTNYINNIPLPSELNVLSSQTHFEEVTDIEINEINIQNSELNVKGNGIISVELEFGPKIDRSTWDENFPFDFEILLGYNENKELIIKKIMKLKADTSSFYE